MTQQTGWSCPKCSRVWAPHIAACGPCNQGVASYPSFGTPGTPFNPPYPVTCGQVLPEWRPTWNFNGDDLSYAHQGGDPA